MTLTQSGQRDFIGRLTEITEANLSNERFGVSELAREMGMSRSNLHRKLKSVKGVSISSFIRQLRLKRAMELLKDSSSSISEIAFEVGFNSVTYFSKCFHDHYGFSPGAIRRNESLEDDSDNLSQPQDNRRFWNKRVSIAFLISAVCGLIAALILIMVFNPFKDHDERRDKSIAILPFINDSPEESEMYFIDGTMESILDNLCKIQDLRVVSRRSVEQYRDNPKPIRIIGEEMNVSYVVGGSGLKYGDDIRLSVQLIDAIDDKNLWSRNYNRKTEEVFELQSEIAQMVAAEIKAIITSEEKQIIETIPTNSLDAYDYYLLGKQYLNRYPTQDEYLWRAIDYFQKAVELDSLFALAFTELAVTYSRLVGQATLSPDEGYSKIKSYALKALAIDERIAESHFLLGEVKSYYEYDFDGAREEYIRALEINPNSFSAHESYARYLIMMGSYDEAALFYNSAQKLNPYAWPLYKYLNHYYLGHRKEAIELIEQFRETHQNDRYVYWWCAILYTDSEMYNKALSMLHIQLGLMGDDNTSDEVGLLGYIYGKTGQTEEAKAQIELLDKLASDGYYIAPRTHVWIYLGLNEVEKAVELLRRSMADHSFNPRYLRNYPREYVQNDSLFMELQKDMGLIE